MTKFQITATLAFTRSSHLGTGLSSGTADRTIRKTFRGKRALQDADGGEIEGEMEEIPAISGDAIKGAIRGSAERIVRWLIPPEKAKSLLDEESDNSRPKHPALRRIFAWQSLLGAGSLSVPSYRFSAPVFRDGGGISGIASTAIDQRNGTARPNTLRMMEQWSRGAAFDFTVDGRGGEWTKIENTDYLDLVLLLAAIQATSQIGGKRGNGMGATRFFGLSVSEAAPIVDAASLTRLRDSLVSEIARA